MQLEDQGRLREELANLTDVHARNDALQKENLKMKASLNELQRLEMEFNDLKTVAAIS